MYLRLFPRRQRPRGDRAEPPPQQDRGDEDDHGPRDLGPCLRNAAQHLRDRVGIGIHLRYPRAPIAAPTAPVRASLPPKKNVSCQLGRPDSRLSHAWTCG